MVLGIVREADRNVRIQMENHLVGDLKDLGYNVFSAYQVYGPKMFQDMNEQQAMIKLVEDSIDAVVTIVLLDKQKERNYVPGRVMYSPYITYHRRVWGYYNSMYMRIEEPGYYEVTTKYFWESNFYDLSINKLLFSVQTQSFSPSSTDARNSTKPPFKTTKTNKFLFKKPKIYTANSTLNKIQSNAIKPDLKRAGNRGEWPRREQKLSNNWESVLKFGANKPLTQ